MVASVPELTKRTISIPGRAAQIRSASSTSSGPVCPWATPRASCSRSASTTSAGLWPRMWGP